MALIKLSNNGVKNITSVGSVGTGELKFISKATASASTSAEFTLTSSYKEFIFYLVNIHNNTDANSFSCNFSTDNGSNYNVTKTTSNFNGNRSSDANYNVFVAGYGNTTSAVDGVQFKFSGGNIDSGTIKLYGIKDS